MKRYSYIAVILAAALLLGGILAGVFLLVKKPAPTRPVPGTILESETAEEEHDAKQNGDDSGNGKTAGYENREEDEAEENGMAAGLSGDLIQAKTQDGEEASDGGRAGQSQEEYCLVSENGFLLVFAKDKSSVFLDTHMPLSEFPLREQERLLDGIWFSSMTEVLNYLESFTS